MRAFAPARSTLPEVTNIHVSGSMRSHMTHALTYRDHGSREQSPPTCGSRRRIRPPFSLDPKREALNPGPILSKYPWQARCTRAFIKTAVGSLGQVKGQPVNTLKIKGSLDFKSRISGVF